MLRSCRTLVIAVLVPSCCLLAEIVFIAVLLLGGVVQERNGDRAAALGDWRTVFAEYRKVLSNEPT